MIFPIERLFQNGIKLIGYVTDSKVTVSVKYRQTAVSQKVDFICCCETELETILFCMEDCSGAALWTNTF